MIVKYTGQAEKNQSYKLHSLMTSKCIIQRLTKRLPHTNSIVSQSLLCQASFMHFERTWSHFLVKRENTRLIAETQNKTFSLISMDEECTFKDHFFKFKALQERPSSDLHSEK